MTDSRIELVPTQRERLVRLAWPWGLLAALFLGQALAGVSWLLTLLAIGLAGFGLYEYLSPRRLVLGPHALELFRFGKTRTVPWGNLHMAYSGSALMGRTATLLIRRHEESSFWPRRLNLHYGYGHNPDDLAQLINDTRAAAVLDEPHPMPAEKLKRIDKWTLILLPLVIFGIGFLMLALGLLD